MNIFIKGDDNMIRDEKYNEYLEEGIAAAKKLAWKYAKGDYNKHLDLLSEAYIGLMKALNTFDESKGYKFITYAGVCMSNQIKMYFRYENRHCRNAYLNDVVGNDKDGSELLLADILFDTQWEEKIIMCEVKELEKLIMDNIDIILPKELYRKVFFLRKKGIYTQQEIAEILGVSRSYISRLYQMINKKIINFLNKEYK